MKKFNIRIKALAVLLMFGKVLSASAYAGESGFQKSHSTQYPPRIPPDVQLIHVSEGLALADLAGHALYVFGSDAVGESRCVENCLNHWQPFMPPLAARGFGDWTISVRNDGLRQWMFKKQPLYFASEVPDTGNSNNRDSQWRRAFYSIDLHPPGIKTFRIETGPTFVTNAGMSLYVLTRPRISTTDTTGTGKRVPAGVGTATGVEAFIPCEGSCLNDWKPLRAAGKVGKLGDWAPVSRPDGARQWAYKGRPVYLYAQDKVPGDRLGELLRLEDRSKGMWRLAEP